MKQAPRLLGGVLAFVQVYFPWCVGAAAPGDSSSKKPEAVAPFANQPAAEKTADPSRDVPSGSSPLPSEVKRQSQVSADHSVTEEMTSATESSLIENPRTQAEEVPMGHLRRGLFWGGMTLGGLGLLAGIGAYAWWRRTRRGRRTNQVVRLLMFPTAYSVPPEPPVPDAIPQMDPKVSQKMRSAA
jgi:hypothetical protein